MSGTSSEHPYSTFALDVYWTSGREGDAALAHHLEGCASCRAYLAMLDGVDAGARGAIASPLPIPFPTPRARRLRAAVVVTATLSFAAGVALFLQTALKTPPPVYVGVKGTPSVQLLVHRGSETAIWNGRSPVRAGDAIALRAACGELVDVAVAAEDPARPGSWLKLSAAPCPIDDDVLPFTLVVDGEASEEHLAIVMSSAPLSGDALGRAAQNVERSPQAWVVRFVIPEERQ